MSHPIGKLCKIIHPTISHSAWVIKDKKIKERKKLFDSDTPYKKKKKKEVTHSGGFGPKGFRHKKTTKYSTDIKDETPQDFPDLNPVAEDPEIKSFRKGGKTKSKKSSHSRGFSQYN